MSLLPTGLCCMWAFAWVCVFQCLLNLCSEWLSPEGVANSTEYCLGGAHPGGVYAHPLCRCFGGVPYWASQLKL